MAKSSRKRAQRKRADYRGGGRVHYEEGGGAAGLVGPDDDDDTSAFGGDARTSANQYFSNLFRRKDGSTAPVYENGVLVSPGTAGTGTRATQHTGNTRQFQQGDAYITGAAGAGQNSATTYGANYTVSGADNIRNAQRDNQIANTFYDASPGLTNAGNAMATRSHGGNPTATTTTTTTPTYTAADVDKAYADLNAGTITAAQLASQYGVTEDYVNTNLASFNAKAAADAQAAATTSMPAMGSDTSTYTGDAYIANEVNSIPADGDYTEAETQVVQDAIASGAISAAEVAAKFGVREDQVKQEIKRREAVQAGIDISPKDQLMGGNLASGNAPDPYADPYSTSSPGSGDFTGGAHIPGTNITAPYKFRDMDAEKAAATQAEVDQANAGGTKILTNPATGQTMEVLINDPRFTGLSEAEQVALVFGTTDTTTTAATTAASVAAIPVDGDYTEFETQQVVDAINSGAMTAEQAATQFGATTAQVEAEMERQNQAAAGEAVTTADPFEGGVETTTDFRGAAAATKAAVDEAARTEAEVESREALDAVGKDISFKDKAGEDAYVPGSFLKDYLAVDKQNLVMQQTSEAIDRTGTITKEEAIQQLASFDAIDVPDAVTSSAITKAVGVVNKAVNDGTVDPGDYEAALVSELSKTIPAFAGAPVKAVMDELRALTDPAKRLQISEAEAASRRASGVDYVIDEKSWVGGVDGAIAQVSDTPEAEAASRAAILGTQASGTEAQIIDSVGFEARQRAVVTGTAAVGAAANAIAAIGDIPAELAAATVEDPASVAAMIDTESVEVQAAIAALPEEALVSGQMQSLLGGMESGVIPAWAKPAVSAVEQKMASRGLGLSTVGRDALFNAIIQTALPMAQSNAQALQANAAQNLTNQQQANLESARLNSTRRLSNLSNQQTSASQTAQFAQNLKVIQSQQTQEAALMTAQNQQQTNVQNLQNRQRTAELQSQNQQQINSQELGNTQQIELAELEIKNQTEQQNMTAANQARLAEFQVASEFLSKNAGFKQQMELANLTNDQQMRLANLSSQNQADAESLSNEQQTELANLNVKMQTNITSANLAAEMNVAQLNVDQQRAITNATTQSKIDLTKFSTAQQVELANSAFMQQTSLVNLNTRQQTALQNATAMAALDLSVADSRTKLGIENARNFLQIQTANLSNKQQALMLDTQMKQQSLLSNANAENVARQFGATSENQVNMFLKSQADAMEQFNSTQYNAMEQFNSAESNRLSALDEQNAIDAAKFNAQIEAQVEQFNAGVENQRDIWNSSNAQAIEQANTNWRRQANTADTAAINASNAQNVQNSYGISTQELDFVWNTIRDDATFLKKEALDTANQKTNLYITAMNNESNTAINTTGVAAGVTTLIDTIFD